MFYVHFRTNANDTLDFDLAKAKDITDSIRLQSSLRQHSRSSYLSSHLNVKKCGKTSWKDDSTNKNDGLDNPIYYEDFASSEAIYKKQLKRFLKEASNMSMESSKPIDDKRPFSQQPVAQNNPGKISVDDTDDFSQTKSKSIKMKATSKQPDKKQFIIDSKERSLVLV